MSDGRPEEILAEVEGEMDARERELLAARLALAADPLDPDPAVRESIMARIGRGDASEPVARARGRGVWGSVAAAVATAAGAAWLTWVVVAPDPAPPVEDSASAELEALLEEQDEEIAALERELGEARDALSVLGAERLERLDLTSAELDASARVYWDWDEYSCYFVAKGLPPAEGSRSYALWLYTDEDEVLLAGRFPGSGSTPASFFAMLPKEMGHVVRAIVTLEPEPAGEAPTGAALLAGGGGDPVGEPPPTG